MPSKKILLLVLVSVCLVGFLFVVKSYQDREKVVKNEQGSPLTKIDEKDTDDDGLKDWEEILLGTNPSKQDSDDDGISDKEEADTNTVEQRDKSLLTQVGVDLKQDANLTETDKITRSIFYDYLVTKSSNNVTSGYIRDLSVRAKNDIFNIESSPTLYKKEALKVITGNITQQGAIQYANSVIAVQKVYPIDANSLSFAGISDAEDPAFQQWALGMSAHFENMTKAFLSVQVPSEFADAHLTVVNDLSKISTEYRIVSYGGTDPMSALSALPRINTSYIELVKTLNTIKSSLDARGIIFSNELGLYIIRP